MTDLNYHPLTGIDEVFDKVRNTVWNNPTAIVSEQLARGNKNHANDLLKKAVLLRRRENGHGTNR